MPAPLIGRETVRPRAHRRAALVAALVPLAACLRGRDSTEESRGAVERTFTPTQYTVEDFYKNTGFRGVLWSPDASTILVSSNLSGIWNAYAVPAAGCRGAGGDRTAGACVPQPLTRSTTNSIFAVSYFPRDGRVLYSSDQ